MPSVPGGNNALVLYHQHHSAPGRAGAVHHALGDNETLAWVELHGAAFEVNEQLPFDDVKELVVLVVFMPVVLALDDGHTHHGLVDLAKRLVEPFVGASVGDGFFFND